MFYRRHLLLDLKLFSCFFREASEKECAVKAERFSKTKQAGRVKREDAEVRNKQMRNEERDKLWWRDDREERDRSDGYLSITDGPKQEEEKC